MLCFLCCLVSTRIWCFNCTTSMIARSVIVRVIVTVVGTVAATTYGILECSTLNREALYEYAGD